MGAWLFLLVWCSFAGLFVFAALALAVRADPFPGAVFFATSSFLLYVGVARLANWTEVRITASEVRVVHGPLPFRRTTRLPRSELSELSCEEWETEEELSFRVLATRHGHPLVLVKELEGLDEALFLKEFVSGGLPRRRAAGS